MLFPPLEEQHAAVPLDTTGNQDRFVFTVEEGYHLFPCRRRGCCCMIFTGMNLLDVK
jgi:hypothetical protein